MLGVGLRLKFTQWMKEILACVYVDIMLKTLPALVVTSDSANVCFFSWQKISYVGPVTKERQSIATQ